MSVDSFKRTIYRHTNVRPKDQDERILKVMQSTKATYEILQKVLNSWQQSKNLKSVNQQCKTVSEFFDQLPALLTKLDQYETWEE